MTKPAHRNQSLDVLRCIAVLLVLGFHYPYYTCWGRLGWIGVDLFFVLSGFLISGLLFQEYKNTGSINFKRFLIRRGLKIYPSFYLLVILALVLSLVTHSALLRKQALLSAVFAQGYYSGTLYTVLSHTWSLAVEEHFYFLLPPLLMLFILLRGRREPFRDLPLLFFVLFAGCLALRWFLLPTAYVAHMTHLRIDSLFAGVTLGYLYHHRRTWFDKLTGPYALVLAFLFCLPAAFLDQYDRRMQTFGITGLLLGFSFLVAWAVVRTPRSTAGRSVSAFAARIGFYSYSIYLWHTVLGETLFSSGASFWKFWAYICICVLAGIGMAHLIELPYLVVRDRLFPVSTVTSVAANSQAPATPQAPGQSIRMTTSTVIP
jgi:peptidoglycan/LPS O-acetylase OafA/YrhL